MPGKSGPRRQPPLFKDLVFNPLPGVKLAMNEAADRSGLSREQIVDAMNGLAQLGGIRGRVSKATLDKWLNPQAENYPPTLAGLQLFCLAVEDENPARQYIKAYKEIFNLMEWAFEERAARRSRRRARQLAPRAGVE